MDKERLAREMLAAELDEPHLATRVIEASADNGVFIKPCQALRAIEVALTATSAHHLLRELHASYIAGGGDMALAARVEEALKGHGTATSERETIVGMLRREAEQEKPFGLVDKYAATWALIHASDAIARGDHLSGCAHLGGGDG